MRFTLVLLCHPADFEASREEEAKLQPARDSTQEHGHQTGQEMRVGATPSGLTDQEPRCACRTVFSFIPYPVFFFFPLPSRAAAAISEGSVFIWFERLFLETNTAFYSHFRISVSLKLRPLDVWDGKSTHSTRSEMMMMMMRCSFEPLWTNEMSSLASLGFYAPKASLRFVFLSCECATRFEIRSDLWFWRFIFSHDFKKKSTRFQFSARPCWHDASFSYSITPHANGWMWRHFMGMLICRSQTDSSVACI